MWLLGVPGDSPWGLSQGHGGGWGSEASQMGFKQTGAGPLASPERPCWGGTWKQQSQGQEGLGGRKSEQEWRVERRREMGLGEEDERAPVLTAVCTGQTGAVPTPGRVTGEPHLGPGGGGQAVGKMSPR